MAEQFAYTYIQFSYLPGSIILLFLTKVIVGCGLLKIFCFIYAIL